MLVETTKLTKDGSSVRVNTSDVPAYLDMGYVEAERELTEAEEAILAEAKPETEDEALAAFAKAKEIEAENPEESNKPETEAEAETIEIKKDGRVVNIAPDLLQEHLNLGWEQV